MKKRLAVYGALAVALIGYLGFLAHRHFGDHVSERNVRELKEGMTKSEVQSVLGSMHDYSGFVIVKGQVHVDLEGSDGTAMLAFDEEDRLIWKAWDETRHRPTLGDRYKRWCRLWDKIRE